MTNVTYDHSRAGTLTAITAAEFTAASPGFTVPAQADWAVTPECAGPPLGFITDNRADAGTRAPSGITPDDDLSNPFEAYDAKGRYIMTTHSLRGALLAVGNRT